MIALTRTSTIRPWRIKEMFVHLDGLQQRSLLAKEPPSWLQWNDTSAQFPKCSPFQAAKNGKMSYWSWGYFSPMTACQVTLFLQGLLALSQFPLQCPKRWCLNTCWRDKCWFRRKVLCTNICRRACELWDSHSGEANPFGIRLAKVHITTRCLNKKESYGLFCIP